MSILFRKKIQATEGQRKDALTTQVVTLGSAKEARGNTYTKYDDIVDQIYKIYKAETKYGAATLPGIINMRSSFIGGAGISITAEKKETQKFIVDLFNYNNFYGSRFIDAVKSGEKEWQCLLLILPDTKNQKLKIRNFSYVKNKYNIEFDEQDTDLIKKITYKSKTENNKEKEIKDNSAVFVKFGDYKDIPKIGKVLTQIENYERALYDLRENNHLFGKNILSFETKTDNEAKVIKNELSGIDLENGFVYAGTAVMRYVTPDLNACAAIEKEMMLNAKIIATETAIPIHWLSWLELINARATAENMSEVISQGTWEERTIWQEKIKELIIKCMVIATELGFEGAVNDPEGFQVSLPLISLSTIQALVSVWLPLQQNDVISMSTLRNRVPEVDANTEKKLIEKEKEENIKRFQESGLNNNLQTNENEDENINNEGDKNVSGNNEQKNKKDNR